MVARADSKSVESNRRPARVERLIGRAGGDIGRLRRVLHRLRDQRLDHLTIAHLRHLRVPSNVRVLEAQGAKLSALDLPTPTYDFIANLSLNPECGAAFEADTLNTRIKELEPYSTWPNRSGPLSSFPPSTTSTHNARGRRFANSGGAGD